MAQPPLLDLRPGVTEPVVLMISRREVQAADLASVLSRLKVFLATREDAWRYRGQMTLVVDGYNNDPRELVDIAEVRALLRGLETEWPYWAYFFNQVDDINDPEDKYTLKALPGKYSGLHLLAIMYTAFRQIDPTMDTGADFSAEYQAALQMQNP